MNKKQQSDFIKAVEAEIKVNNDFCTDLHESARKSEYPQGYLQQERILISRIHGLRFALDIFEKLVGETPKRSSGGKRKARK